MLTGFVKLQDHDESIGSKGDFKLKNDLATKQVHISF